MRRAARGARRLSLSGLGLTTSCGLGVVGSCAAARAGLSRPAILGGTPLDGVAGHPVSSFSDGFYQRGAWIRLALGACSDLWDRGGFTSGREPPPRLILLTPEPDASRSPWAEDLDRAEFELSIAHRFQLHLEPVAPSIRTRAEALGSTGLAQSLGAWAEADGVTILAAADSLVDPDSLEWLAGHGRLKTPDSPAGLMPGEAGAALLLESEHSARLRKAEVLGHVEAVAVGAAPPAPPPARKEGPDAAGADGEAEELPPPMPDGAPLGRALADAVRQVLPQAAGGARWVGDLYLDLNGEEWKAQGWGHALVHLSRHLDLEACRTFLPAESLGETGAASAPIGVALALYNFAQDGTRGALVLSMADDGQVSAIRLSAPRPPSE